MGQINVLETEIFQPLETNLSEMSLNRGGAGESYDLEIGDLQVESF